MNLRLPKCLDWMRTSESGRAWLEALPGHVATAAHQWQLDLGEPYEDSFVSLVLPAVRAREDLILKVQFPHRESEHEAQALRDWGGNGAVRLMEHDPGSHALLIERCTPGDHLSQAGAEAGLQVMTDLLPRLWVPADKPYGSLAAEVDGWVNNLPAEYERAGEPFDRALLDEALDVLPALAATQGDQVLVHQDLHGDNVLRAQREPWLAIDPKPLAGEREFALSPTIRSYEFGHSEEDVIGRLDRLTGKLGLDRERVRFQICILMILENSISAN